MNTTQSMKPLQIKTEHAPPPSDVRWSPHELNAKYPIFEYKAMDVYGNSLHCKTFISTQFTEK